MTTKLNKHIGGGVDSIVELNVLVFKKVFEDDYKTKSSHLSHLKDQNVYKNNLKLTTKLNKHIGGGVVVNTPHP